MILLSALSGRHLRADPADPHWPDRDRLLLSACTRPAVPARHGMVVAGPPGLAVGAALGMAIAERAMAARFGRSLVDHRIWLHAAARDLVAGTAQEAAPVAGALRLGRLAVLAALPADQPGLRAGFTAAGWTVRVVPAGDAAAADVAIAACLRAQKPSLVLEIGAQDAAPDASAPSVPMPGATLDAPVPAEKRGIGARRAWLKRLRRHASQDAFNHALSGRLPTGWQTSAHVEAAGAHAAHSTEGSVAAALVRVAAILPDLTLLPGPAPACLHAAIGHGPAQVASRAATDVSWDGRDLAAAAALLGMALHGGILPVSIADPALAAWALPSLAAAATRQARWLHILSGPAPIAALPDIANLHIYHPADAAEALDCLVLSLRRPDGPCLLLLSSGPYARLPAATPHLCARGAYLVHAPPKRDLTLLAAGPGLATALGVHDALAAQGVQAALVSMPCRTLFDQQVQAYRQLVLPTPPAIVAITTGSALAFAGLTGPGDLVLDSLAVDGGARVMAAMILRHLHRHAAVVEV